MKKLIGLLFFSTALFADDPASLTDQPADAAVDESCVEEVPECPVEEVAPVELPCEEECEIKCDDYGSFFLTEFKMGYFRFGDKKLRKMYNEGLLDLQLTSSINFWKRLYAYVGVEYIESRGRLHHNHHKKIRIHSVPLSLGVQYMKPITFDLNYYLTLGPRYFIVHQSTHRRSLTRSGFGGFINTGFLYYINHHIVFDMFGEYSCKNLRFSHLGGNLQVGGLTIGAGIGYFW